MAGSTSFGWMTPFDWFSSLLKFWPGAVGVAPGAASRGAESRGAVGVGAGFGAWANAGPATRVAPATNRQSRDWVNRILLKRVDGRTVPWRAIAKFALKQCGASRTQSVDELQQQTTDFFGLLLLNPMSGATLRPWMRIYGDHSGNPARSSPPM
jgi:hypothetical protein